ncbi:probable calcium-binding protein CML10 [Selaginella moellendorffii]|nr:probable calcium-binding protein CML10 [Selaginella moellendorffii]|eukprot:XP_002968790.2 probable calcium-binding protein CML10 [Selaginella moellendorffii]
MLKFYRSLRGKKSDRDSPVASIAAEATVPSPARSIDQRAKELEQVFRSIDTDGDGRICLEELRAMLRLIGNANPDDTELLGLLRAIDSDGDGFISLEEFLRANDEGGSSADDLRAAFQVFDIDGNGFISADELHCVLQKMGDKITKSECRRMIKGVDSDGNGLVDFEEFRIMMAPSQDSLQQ